MKVDTGQNYSNFSWGLEQFNDNWGPEKADVEGGGRCGACCRSLHSIEQGTLAVTGKLLLP